MITWIRYDIDDRWPERRAHVNHLATLPQPCYWLAGPGLFPEEGYFLLSSEPFTEMTVLATLVRIAGASAPDPHDDYAAWVAAWLYVLQNRNGAA